MQVETLKDVLHWTAEFHQQLASRLKHDAMGNKNKRAHLLLDYLSRHEQSLSDTLRRFEADGISQALNSWCYEYLDQHPLTRRSDSDVSLSALGPDEIMIEIFYINQQVLSLYRNLYDRATTSSAKELLQNLLELEQHEAMQMTQGANRLRDI